MDFLLDLLLNFDGPMPYLIVLTILLLCGLGLPIPEDVTLIVAGLAAYYGVCNIWGMMAVCLFGVILGDVIIFTLGYKYGRSLAQKPLFSRMLSAERLDAVALKFRTRGKKLLFAARFMPGLRAPIFFSAGTLHVPVRSFLFYDGSAALLSVPLIVGAIYRFGDYLDSAVRWIRNAQFGILGLITFVMLLTIGKWFVQRRKLKRASVGARA